MDAEVTEIVIHGELDDGGGGIAVDGPFQACHKPVGLDLVTPRLVDTPLGLALLFEGIGNVVDSSAGVLQGLDYGGGTVDCTVQFDDG